MVKDILKEGNVSDLKFHLISEWIIDWRIYNQPIASEDVDTAKNK